MKICIRLECKKSERNELVTVGEKGENANR
jgi:hypothetical protein